MALDDRTILRRAHRPKWSSLPPEPAFISSWTPLSRRLAIGDDWMAEGHLFHWRVVTAKDISPVAVVEANIMRTLYNTAALYAPGPLLVIRTRDDKVLKVDVRRVPDEARRKVAWLLPEDPQVGEVAAPFLRDGTLPGRSARPFQVLGFRFGRPFT